VAVAPAFLRRAVAPHAPLAPQHRRHCGVVGDLRGDRGVEPLDLGIGLALLLGGVEAGVFRSLLCPSNQKNTARPSGSKAMCNLGIVC
jgi:hypothetical protein